MPLATGILDICAGASSLIGSLVLFFLGLVARSIPYNVSEPVPEFPFTIGSTLFVMLAMMLFVFGILAVIGGVYVLRRSRGFWPILGAIAATLSFFPLGIPAIVLTVMAEQDPSSAGLPEGGHGAEPSRS
jgi:hypothetical protein